MRVLHRECSQRIFVDDRPNSRIIKSTQPEARQNVAEDVCKAMAAVVAEAMLGVDVVRQENALGEALFDEMADGGDALFIAWHVSCFIELVVGNLVAQHEIRERETHRETHLVAEEIQLDVDASLGESDDIVERKECAVDVPHDHSGEIRARFAQNLDGDKRRLERPSWMHRDAESRELLHSCGCPEHALLRIGHDRRAPNLADDSTARSDTCAHNEPVPM
jgi:hypothetical protein